MSLLTSRSTSTPASLPAPMARRALAIFALIVAIAAILNVLVAPATPATPPALSQPVVRDAAGPIAPPENLPRLCDACGAAAPPWLSADHSPLVKGAGGAAIVNPRDISAASSEAPPDPRFGVVEAFAAPYTASYAGVGWERVNFDWPSLQPKGPFMWNRAAVSGAMLAREIAAGRQIIGIIGGRPAWAVDAHGIPQGLYLPPNDPRNQWGAFVTRLVRRYEGRVQHWIIWNEPDVWNPHSKGYTWPGTVADFARLLKVAYVQIKRIDPHMVVHLAATTYWWDRAYGRPLYLGRLFDELAKDPNARKNNWYFDVASAHIYNVPEDVETILRIDKDLMHAHGFDKPIWLVETNALPTRDGPWAMTAPHWNATAAEQSAFVAQATALALAAGAGRVSFYKMADPRTLSPSAYPVGLVRPDGSARPVVAALRATTHALAGFVSARDLGSNGTARAVLVNRGAHGGTLVLWNTAAQATSVTVSVPVPRHATPAWLATHIYVVADDDTYRVVPMSISGGRAIMQLQLAASECARDNSCHIGGAPLMVVAPSLPSVDGLAG